MTGDPPMRRMIVDGTFLQLFASRWSCLQVVTTGLAFGQMSIPPILLAACE